MRPLFQPFILYFSSVLAFAYPQEKSHASLRNGNNILRSTSPEWMEIGKKVTSSLSNQHFGTIVDISDDGVIFATGSSSFANEDHAENLENNQIHIFKLLQNDWVPMGSSTITGQTASLSSDGKILATGVMSPSGTTTRVYRFEEVESDWIQMGNEINSTNDRSDDNLGFSFDLSGDGLILAMGAPQNNGNGLKSGAVFVYEYVNADWKQVGDTIHGKHSADHFGHACKLSKDGTILSVGAPALNTDKGYVSVFQYDGWNWKPLGGDLVLHAPGKKIEIDHFGFAIDLSESGKILAVGAPRSNQSKGCVQVWAFHENELDPNPEGWEPFGNIIHGGSDGGQHGYSVSLNSEGTVLAIGAPFHSDVTTNLMSGSTKIFRFIPFQSNWLQVGNDIEGNDLNEESGITVALSGSGERIAVGGPYSSDLDGKELNTSGDNDHHVGVGGVKVFKHVHEHVDLEKFDFYN